MKKGLVTFIDWGHGVKYACSEQQGNYYLAIEEQPELLFS